MQVLSKIISDGNGGRKMKVLGSGILHNLGVYAPRNVDKYIWCIHGAFDNPSKLNKGQGAVMNMLGHIQRDVTKEEVERFRMQDEVEAMGLHMFSQPGYGVH